MMSVKVKKLFIAAALLAAGGFGAVAPSQALTVGGRWDPLYGSPFLDTATTNTDMWWSGQALFTVPDTVACAATAVNSFLVTCGGMFVSNAKVFLSDGSGGPVVDTLSFAGTLALTKVKFGTDGTTVLWVESNWWNPLAAGSATQYNLSNYLFSVSFAQQGANLFHTGRGIYLEAHGGHGPDDKVLFWNGEGNGHIGDLCSPVNAPGDGDLCGFSNTIGTMVFAPIPEPSTYALMLAGLGALAFMARRRRRT